jgi:hypothetical protein
LNRIYAFADLPIRISPNPNNEISIDHFHFSDCYFSANANPIVLIDSGINLTQVIFDGYQAWVSGTHGLYWADTETTQVSNGLTLCNIRWEQGTDPAAYSVYIRHGCGLQGLRLRQTYGGFDRNGIFLRNVSEVLLDSIYHAGPANIALDVDHTVSRIKCLNAFWQAGAIANFNGQNILSASPKSPDTAPLPVDFESDITDARGLTCWISLSNGLNSNIDLPSAPIVNIKCDSGPFSVGGFAGGTDGARLRVYNSNYLSSKMTILNQDPSSSPANRILTGLNASVTVTMCATLRYEWRSKLWLLENYN